MALTVVVRSGDADEPPTITFDSPRVVIGRGDGCEVRLPDPSVSHRHASIRQRGTEYIVLDEGSTNGTFVGPVRLSPHSPRVLRSGDLIRVGRIWLEVRIEQVMPTRNAATATAEIALGLVQSALQAQGETAAVHVRVLEGPDAGRELLLERFDRPYVVGRSREADLSVEDADASRRHVEITRRGNLLNVRDLGSKNGSHLGDEALPANKERPWKPKTLLGVGANRLIYEDPVAEALEELERAADERMLEEDSVEPPTAEESSSDAPSDLDAVAAAVESRRGGGPVIERPRPQKTGVSRRGGWTATDFAVLGLSLLVLSLSVLGLFWLFGSE